MINLKVYNESKFYSFFDIIEFWLNEIYTEAFTKAYQEYIIGFINLLSFKITSQWSHLWNKSLF